MVSDASLSLKSNTTHSQSRPRYAALYMPSPEHRFAPGIPARNLTEAEVELYGVDNLRNAQCYQLVEVEPPEPESDEKEE